ncbi:hypothetical protein LTR28_004346 [Elasticomyces elasticus]|nr:hypothetical protein LTR28_004346 [Elasticomyces elasticus]
MAGAGEVPAAAASRVESATPRQSSHNITFKTSSAKPSQARSWNTKNLGFRLGADVAAAATAGGMVAPVITMIDRAIIENAARGTGITPSLRRSLLTLLTRPHTFLLSRPFFLVFALYTGTYTTANALDTLTSTLTCRPASSSSGGPAKFAATSAANLSLCLYKDSQFTRLFGAAPSSCAAAARAVPAASYALFAARDCLTIFASFNLPPLLAPSLHLGPAVERYVSRASAAQFLAPAAVQLVSTPLHLLGLDLFNRNGETGWRSRGAKVRADWVKSAIARVARVVPAFGVGGVVNLRVRGGIMKGLE